MSDFISSGWALYVSGIVIASIAFCVFVLVVAAKRRPMADDNTTGHVWDQTLQELNNPLPRWWMGLFVITIVFAVLYLALYPGLGTNEGTLKWTSRNQWQAEQAKAAETMKPVYAKFASMPVEALAADSQAMGIGERIFVNNCAGCHGADAKGSKSFPNLTDGDWLGGDGSHDYIIKTITEGRQGMMPPMAAAVGSADDVKNVANYVLSLSGAPHNEVAAQLGKSKFGACAACHGADGKGNPAVGAPNLTDKVWLHGWGSEAMIVGMITNGKTNVMPQHATRLTADQIRVLAAYVWGLSHKPANKTAMATAQ
ncbi:MAG TPA: cytochrome-c oxidase, cbb3-type subunit III [Burkholderiaceae bacterium]|nr:cytochrome-c oxidase, cbb3-type subunit III [Burkholderiaceae bacterium]HMX12267.1 cytochrome-c oxidase, cbb3-type subunit III [Burkholderiaceae bacterium]HMZ01721.1 cytochrome-c oxidase, cbb3-type subunit III [Burkholderiaceae bacterium]HNB43020.1 cytochrome-c oxidase, cbb3-type subunit III [Burkholderiaceae bacterium]HNG80277.1 cytochrome-c oxidase, cbb3-type subunit III [Burkholderiaceae bacterium]